MALDRRPAPGRNLIWAGAASELAAPGEVGIFVDFDGGPDCYVVDFGPGRTFCCHPDEVLIEAAAPSHEERRHRSKG